MHQTGHRIGPPRWTAGRHRKTADPRRWFALLLVFALAVSAIVHVAGWSHEAFAAPHSHEPYSHELAATAQPGDDGPCRPADQSQIDDAICTMASGCPFCGLVSSPAILALPEAQPAEPAPAIRRAGILLSPSFRPPRFLSDI